jgi:hypothetical protein
MAADLVQQPLYAPDAVFIGWQLLLWPTGCPCFLGPRPKQPLIVARFLLSLHDEGSCCYATLAALLLTSVLLLPLLHMVCCFVVVAADIQKLQLT